MWAFIIGAAAVIVAAVLYCLRRRQKRQNDFEIAVDSEAEESFYPEIEKCHEINTKSITCSCPDFRKEREQFRHDDPRRLCKHLVKSFIDANSLPDDLMLYKKGIERSAEGHNGFPTGRKRFDKLIDSKKSSLMIPQEVTEENSWIDVYYEARRYSYSPELQKWADETAPPQEEEIIRFVYEKLGDPIPEAVLNRIKTLSRTQPAKKENQGKIADGESGGFQVLEPLLRTLLPPDGELALKETKSYLAVTFNGSRKWVCRLYLNSKKSKYIEFPDGGRYELNAVEDIADYKEQLINAYNEQSPKKGKARMLFPLKEHAPSSYRVTPAVSRDNVDYFSRN